MKRRKVTVAVLSVVLAAAALTGCGSAQQTNGPKKTRVVLNEVAHSIFYAPMYVAIEEGYFEDAGIDLELVTGFGADKTMTGQLSLRAGNFLVAREPIDDFSWDMLKGTTVLGGRAGGMPEMVFEYILEKNNMDPTTDLSIDQSIDFGSTAAAFSGGQGDFTIEFEPHATLLEQKGDGYVVASLGEESGYVPYTSFSAKKSYLEKNPETIQAFTDALQKGMDYVQEHSAEEIAKCIAPQFAETESDTLTAIVARYQEQDTWKEDLIFHKDAFDLLQNILEDSDVLKERVPYETLVTTEFAEKAAAR